MGLKGWNKHLRRAWGVAALASLGACTTVPSPTLDASAWTTGVSYPQAMTYLKTARDSLQTKQTNLDTFDTATKVGVGAGVAGVVIGSVFKSGIHPILTSATVAGGSYELNQVVYPTGLYGVYSAGVSNLDCIRSAATEAYGNIEVLSPQLDAALPQLEAAMNALRSDLLLAGDNPLYATEVATAQADLAKAEGIDVQIRRFLSQRRLGEQVVFGVDRTLEAVNAQARSRSPSVESIWRAGAGITGFLTNGDQLRTDLRTAVAGMGKVAATSQSDDKLAADFAKHELVLRAVLARIPTTSITADMGAIAACQAQFAALGTVTVSPSGAISLQAGSTVSLMATGRSPFQVMWIGETPRDVRVNNLPQLSLSADATAVTKTYVMRVVDIGGTASSDITLNVVAKPAEPAPDKADKTNKAAGAGAGKGPPTPPGH